MHPKFHARQHSGAGLALLMLIALGCATASVQTLSAPPRDGTLAKPPVLLVYDFATSAYDVAVDSLGPSVISSGSQTSKQAKTAHKIAQLLSEKLAQKLNARGIRAKRATDGEIPPIDAFILRGHFLTIDEGSRVMRMVVGFGAGGKELRVRVQVYQQGEEGTRRIASAEAWTTDSKMPGMAVPVGAGAMLGNAATSAMISGGMNVAQEVTGRMSQDVDRLAEKLADRAAKFYGRQRWI